MFTFRNMLARAAALVLIAALYLVNFGVSRPFQLPADGGEAKVPFETR